MSELAIDLQGVGIKYPHFELKDINLSLNKGSILGNPFRDPRLPQGRGQGQGALPRVTLLFWGCPESERTHPSSQSEAERLDISRKKRMDTGRE